LPSEAVSVACALQVVPLRTNTRTLPWLLIAPTSSSGTPTASVSPERETEKPKESDAAPSAATSVACAVQVVSLRTNTRTVPWTVFAPTSSYGTPTASVSPERETE